jgi:hypothetical protein
VCLEPVSKNLRGELKLLDGATGVRGATLPHSQGVFVSTDSRTTIVLHSFCSSRIGSEWIGQKPKCPTSWSSKGMTNSHLKK